MNDGEDGLQCGKQASTGCVKLSRVWRNYHVIHLTRPNL